MVTYVGVVGGRLTSFSSMEEFRAAGAVQPSALQLGQAAVQAGATSSTYQSAGGSNIVLSAGSALNITDIRLASDPLASLAIVGGQRVAVPAAAAAAGGGGWRDIMAGLGFATRSGDAAPSQSPIQAQPGAPRYNPNQYSSPIGPQQQVQSPRYNPNQYSSPIGPTRSASPTTGPLGLSWSFGGVLSPAGPNSPTPSQPGPWNGPSGGPLTSPMAQATGSAIQSATSAFTAGPAQFASGTVAGIAEESAKLRPGFYGLPGEGFGEARTIGDSLAAGIASGFMAKGYSKEAAFGAALEQRRAESYAAGDVRGTQYYSGELQKLVSRPIEQASQYHYLGQRSGIPVPSNPWEYASDLSVEFLKGAPTKASEMFSPVSGEMAKSLPGGFYGLQQWSWDVALATDRPDKYARAPAVSFMGGLEKLRAAEGQYGPYGTLFGGPGYIGTPSSEGIRKQADFIFTQEARANVAGALALSAFQRGETTIAPMMNRFIAPDSGEFIPTQKSMGVEMARGPDGRMYPAEFAGGQSGWIRGSKTIAGIPEISGAPAAQPQASPIGSFVDAFGGALSKTFAFTPGGMGLAIAVDTARGKSPFVGTPTGDIFGFYTSMNRAVSRYSTDITGIGAQARATPDIEGGGIAGTAANIGLGFYGAAAERPIDIGLLYGGGWGYGAVKAGAKTVVARSAMSGVPGVATAGRALSTPLAADFAGVAETGAGLFFMMAAGVNIITQPTPRSAGAAAGATAVQFGGFGAGMAGAKFSTPENIYAGRQFFSGKMTMGPAERFGFKAQTAVRSLVTSNRATYREVAAVMPSGRFVEPVRKGEPDFSALSRAGPFAKEIKQTLGEQPHSVIGSASVRGQYPPGIAEMAGIRTGKDVDVLVESPSKAIARLSGLARITPETAKGVMDVHPIPQGYPGFKPSAEAETVKPEYGFLSSVFGDPYKSFATPRGSSEIVKPGTAGYAGQLAYEAVQVQAGRKAAAVAAFIESPATKGYRAEKDIFDFISIYKAQRAVAISRGTPASEFAASDKAMRSFMSREFTYPTQKGGTGPTVTKTVRQIYQEQAAAGKPFRVETSTPPGGVVRSVMGAASIGSPVGSFIAAVAPSMSRMPSGFRSSPTSPVSSFVQSFGTPSASTPSGMRSSPASGARSMESPSFVPVRSFVSPPRRPSSPVPSGSPWAPSRPGSGVPSSFPGMSPSRSPPPARPTVFTPSQLMPVSKFCSRPTALPGGFNVPGGGSGVGPGYRGSWKTTFTNTVGVDLYVASKGSGRDLFSTGGYNFKKAFRKFRLPRW